jgi:hypothetical protein
MYKKSKKLIILICGFGGIGKHYFKALESLTNLRIDILENNPEKWIKHEKARFINIDKLEKQYDLVVSCVGAESQKKVLDLLRIKTTSKFWIIEKNITQSLDELVNFTYPENTYINLWLRNTKIIEKIRELSKLIDYVEIEINDNSLLCNIIHYADLLEQAFGSRIRQIHFESKIRYTDTRRDYAKELTGKFYGHLETGLNFTIYGNNSIGEITTFQGFKKGLKIIKVDFDNFLIYLNNDDMYELPGWLVSENFSAVAGKLINKNSTKLPQAKETAILQYKIMKAILNHTGDIDHVPFC